MKQHDLYKTGDPDAPDVIKDRNGEVVLEMCKVCGRAEIELSEPCTYKVWVVMSNDFPDSVWSSEDEAKKYVQEKMDDPENITGHGYTRRIYYRAYQFKVK